jgi:uncharacterized membrane-anchored protein
MNASIVRGLTILGALLVLGGVNYSMYAKERIKRDGETILLELAPVDPRSLMQGDYMALRFRIGDELDTERREQAHRFDLKDDTVGLQLDARRVATLAPAQADSPLRMRYRIRNERFWLGTNAYFFEEGTAKRYEPARFGEFRLERGSGEAVLVGMRDEHLEPL